MPRWFVLIALIVCLAPAAHADEGRSVEIEHEAVLVNGLAAKGGALAAPIRVTVQGGDASITWVASDLQPVDGTSGGAIMRDRVRVTGTLRLVATIPADFVVSISRLQQPGTYKGTLTCFLQWKDAGGASQHLERQVPYRIVVRMTPVVKIVDADATIKAQLVQEGSWLQNWLSSVFLPDAARKDHWTLAIENVRAAPARILGTAITVRDGSGSQLDPTLLQAHAGKNGIIAPGFGAVGIDWDRGALPAGRYRGAIRLDLEDAETHVTVPVDIAVRNPPLWPLLLVILGIAIGRLARFMRDEGEPLLDALRKIDDLEREVAEAPPARHAKLQAQVDELRGGVVGGTVANVDAEIARIRALLKEALAEADEMGGSALRTSDEPGGLARYVGTPLMRLLGWIAGVDVRSSRVGLIVIGKTLLGVLLLLFLVHMGMQKLYVQSGATFGASALGDYVGLVLWGLTSEVVNKTLFSFRM